MAELALFNVVEGHRLKTLKTHKNFGTWTDMIPGDFFNERSEFFRTDLLFYNANTGSAAFYRCSGEGEVEEVRSIGNGGWRTGLKVLPGRFSGSALTDLIFYDPKTGNVALYENTGDALMVEKTVIQGAMDKGLTHATSERGLLSYDADSGSVARYESPWLDKFTAKETEVKPRHWRPGWSHLVPINFTYNFAPEILFYDEKTGDAEFFTYESGELKSVKKLPGGWKKGLTHIVSAYLQHWKYEDLLFYDRNEGSAAIYWHQENAPEKAPFIEALKIQPGGWRKTWDAIVPGRFSGLHGIGADYEHVSDLAFYSAEDY